MNKAAKVIKLCDEDRPYGFQGMHRSNLETLIAVELTHRNVDFDKAKKVASQLMDLPDAELERIHTDLKMMRPVPNVVRQLLGQSLGEK